MAERLRRLAGELRDRERSAGGTESPAQPGEPKPDFRPKDPAADPGPEHSDRAADDFGGDQIFAEPAAAENEKRAAAPTAAPRLGALGSSRSEAIRDRLAGLREGGGDAWSRLRTGGSGAWSRLPLGLRQRLAAGLALAALVVVIVLIVVPIAPCWVPGGDRCTPEDEALALVPADALAYAHATLGTETDEFEDATALGERLPVLVGDALAALPSATGRLLNYDRDVRPWSGDEAALVVDSQGAKVERLLMFEVEDAEAAAEFGRARLGFGAETADVGGVEVSVDGDGFAWAIDGGFLLLGPEASVRRSLGVVAGDEEALADEVTVETARELLPEDRFADVWISPELAALATFEKSFRGLDTFVNEQATDGVAVSLSLREDAIEVAVRSLQDPELAAASPGFFATLPAFEPRLPGAIGADALAYLGLGSPSESAEQLLAQAAGAAPDLLAGIESFGERLAGDEGVDIQRQLLPLLAGEVAVTVEPPETGGAEAGGDEQTPGLAPAVGAPYVALLADEVDAEAARAAMADLQAPIAAAVEGDGSGSVSPPLFETQEIAGVEAAGLRISEVVELTYAAYDDRLIVGSSPVAVERARSVSASLGDDEKFEQVTEDMPDEPSLLAYVDVRDLLTLGERIGLATDPAYARIAGDLRTLEAAALSVRLTDDLLATDLTISVGEREVPAADSPVLEVEPG